MSSGGTETITIRTSKEVLNRLREYAKEENITINSVINNCLIQSIEWSIPAKKAEWVPAPKRNLVAIMELLEEKEIIKVASELGHSTPKETLLIMRGKYGLKEWLSVLKSRSKAAGFEHTEISDGHFVVITMKHNMGLKWSLFFKELYSAVFEDLNHRIEFEITPNITQYKIPKELIA